MTILALLSLVGIINAIMMMNPRIIITILNLLRPYRLRLALRAAVDDGPGGASILRLHLQQSLPESLCARFAVSELSTVSVETRSGHSRQRMRIAQPSRFMLVIDRHTDLE